ncbi:type VII secretion protein EccC [Mycetocola saprophilus]|uniref:type VII secretion protein EccC n=1 Tax=Mycetocola saprophilus TaxID=76636 RepID=UPI0005BAAEBB|nr:type VII secretion protein EccC [Mycetocola saprophilus]
MNSRLAPPRVPTGSISVQAPPEMEPSDGGSSILTSMMPMLGSVGAIIMVSISNAGPTGFLTGGMVLLSSLGFVFVNGWRQRSQRAAATLTSRREYLAYLTELRTTVRSAAKAQRQERNWRYPEPSVLPFLAEEGTRVWERDPSASDFLSVRIGTNDQPLCMTLEPPELPPVAQLDPVSTTAAHRFILTHETQRALPSSIELSAFSSVQLVGDDEDRIRGLARAMIAHIATFEAPENVQIVIVADPESLPLWEWAKWLPHTRSTRATDALGAARMISSDVNALTAMMPADVRERSRFSPDSTSSEQPHLIVVVDGATVPPTDPVFVGGLQGVTVIDLPASWDSNEDPNVARLMVEGDTTHVLAGVLQHSSVHQDALSIVEAEALARRLSPLAQSEEQGGGAVGTRTSNRQLELIELLNMPDVRDMDLESAWALRPERDRLRVPIGQDTTGAPLVLDIKESAKQGMGPHGIMIGATGSGKSEVLRTLVLSLALTHSPDELNFVLVDFKGGATFAGMADMPHVSAIITNLGDEISLVDRFQDALTGEVVRRQELLRATGPFANVTEYEKARRSDRPELAPLPALMIVADEFSELLSAKPEFVESFVNIGRVGRSLHVHMLLASQRLEEHRLKGLDTYLSYRIGLRTFSAAESRSVLGVPDAYHLPSEPGGGYLKANTDEMVQFRAAYVSGPPRTKMRGISSRAAAETIDAPVRISAFTAAPVLRDEPEIAEEVEIEQPVNPAEPAEKRSTFDLAVSKMSESGMSAHQVWLPPLEIPPTLDELFGELVVSYELGLHSPAWRRAIPLTVPLGLVDVPLEQRRDTLTVDLSGAAGHVAIVGGPLSGKSTLARTLVTALSLRHTPHEVQFFVLDFGGSFAGMRHLPHLAGLATRTESDIVRRSVAEVTALLDAREAYFRANGIDSIATYRTRRAAGTADDGYGDIFLIIDGIGTIRSDYESLEAPIQLIAARGLSYGVHVVITAGRWMEVRPNLKDLLGTRLELKLGDPVDSEVNRKAAGNVTPGRPGRGLAPSTLQMLTALPRIDADPDSGSLSQGVDDLVNKTSSAWVREPGPKLRLLPEELPLAQVLSDEQANLEQLQLGIDESTLSPFGIDPRTEAHLFLYGDSGSGKSTMLRGYIHEIMRRYAPGEARIFMIDYRRANLGEIPAEYLGAYMTGHEQTTDSIAQLVDFFRSRLPGPDVTAEQLRTRSWWSGAEGFVLIDDYDLVATSQGNPAAPLSQLLAQAADVGLHVVVTRRSGGASRAAYDPVLQGMTDLGVTGILLSGNPEEGQLIGKVKAMPSVPGRAQVVSRERGHFIAQLVHTPSIHEDPAAPGA